MTMTLSDAYELFKKKYPNEKLCVSMFKKINNTMNNTGTSPGVHYLYISPCLEAQGQGPKYIEQGTK